MNFRTIAEQAVKDLQGITNLIVTTVEENWQTCECWWQTVTIRHLLSLEQVVVVWLHRRDILSPSNRLIRQICLLNRSL